MNNIRILMLEDNPIDARIIQKLIINHGLKADFTVAATGAQYIEELDNKDFDIILSDHQLPDFDSIKALHARNAKQESIPFILITGAISDEIALAIIRQGADDYILKDRLQRLPLAVKDVLERTKIDSAKKSIEASFSKLRERFQLAAKTSFDIIWDYDLEKNRIYCSDAIEKIIGLQPKESFHPDELKKFIHPVDLSSINNSFVLMVKGRESRWRKIFRAIKLDGSERWINSNALVVRNKEEKVTRIVGVLHDVTEIRQLQHEIVDMEMKKQKQIADVALQAQEKERNEIGKELHDNVNQLLATAKIMIDTAKSSPELQDICLDKSQESIMDAINELRNIAHAMMPPVFEDHEFGNIIKDLLQKYQLAGKIKIHLQLPSNQHFKNISAKVKLALYRIIQEQLVNIDKHAKAKNFYIQFQVSKNRLAMELKDDGIGFDPFVKAKGIGLKNMESRVAVFGGNFQVISAPGKGCAIKIEMPVNIKMLV